MRFASVPDIQALDAAAKCCAYVPESVAEKDALMHRAVLALTDFVASRTAQISAGAHARPPEVYVVYGKGNNGKDARLAGECLQERGFCVHFLPVGHPQFAFPDPISLPAIILDGILGIGLKGAPRDDAATAIRCVNHWHDSGACVIAVDIPSGVPADVATDAAPDPAVHADTTLTMGLPKACFLNDKLRAFCGSIYLADIGYPSEALLPVPTATNAAFFCESEARHLLPPPAYASHKGSYAHVRLFVGSPDYPGAARLCANAALRAGAGLVSAHIPREIAPMVALDSPELILRSYDESALSPAVIQALPQASLNGAVVAAGCGLSQAPSVRSALRELIARPEVSAFVLDADALNNLFRYSVDSALPILPFPQKCVLTPHPGEAARMLGISTAEVQADRPVAARSLAEKTGAVVVLKGAGTLVAAPDKPLTLIPVGNPALGKGGSGDLLCGIIAAQLARGLSPFDAACLGVYLHGKAADLAILRYLSPRSFNPSDLLAFL